MNPYLFTLLTETSGTAAPSGTDPVRLIIEYVIYAAVIVVGILILLLLRRKTRLPRHGELRGKLAAFSEDLESFRKETESGSFTRL